MRVNMLARNVIVLTQAAQEPGREMFASIQRIADEMRNRIDQAAGRPK
jgi:hypothetical protein